MGNEKSSIRNVSIFPLHADSCCISVDACTLAQAASTFSCRLVLSVGEMKAAANEHPSKTVCMLHFLPLHTYLLSRLSSSCLLKIPMSNAMKNVKMLQ